MPCKVAIAEVTGDPLDVLSDKQKLFVDGIMRGMTQTMAARAAGYSRPNTEGYRLMQMPAIHEAITITQRKYERASQMTRKKVMNGFLEAIEMARLQSDSAVMVNGWREIGRMCGYYAPEKKVLDINITAKRVVSQLETMSDAELLNMIEEDSEMIEGEFMEVMEATQDAADSYFDDDSDD